MGRFFRPVKRPPRAHSVITHFVISGDAAGTQLERDEIMELEERISDAVEAVGGEHDGSEFGGGEAVLYTYGPDADALFTAIFGCLATMDLLPGAYAIKRYGAADDPDAREERVEIS